MMNRDSFVEELKSQIDQWNANIGKLEAEMKAATDEAQARYAEQIAEASKLRAEGQEKLAEAMKAAPEQWEKMQKDMTSAWQDIADGFQKAWSRFT